MVMGRAQVITLIEAKPNGVLALLNEECVVPRGSDSSFVEKLFQVNTSLAPPSPPPPSMKGSITRRRKRRRDVVVG